MSASRPLIGTGAALALLVGAAQLLRPAAAPLPGAAVFPDPPTGPIRYLPSCLSGWSCIEQPGRVLCSCASETP